MHWDVPLDVVGDKAYWSQKLPAAGWSISSVQADSAQQWVVHLTRKSTRASFRALPLPNPEGHGYVTVLVLPVGMLRPAQVDPTPLGVIRARWPRRMIATAAVSCLFAAFCWRGRPRGRSTGSATTGSGSCPSTTPRTVKLLNMAGSFWSTALGAVAAGWNAGQRNFRLRRGYVLSLSASGRIVLFIQSK